MKFIFTYDSSELEDLERITHFDKSIVEEKHVLTISKDENDKPIPRNLFDVAKDVKDIVDDPENESPSIIFINQYLSCADDGFEWLQHNAGIALIKFLRMMKVREHIVLITPYKKLRLVQENPANLIVTSKGVSCKKYIHKFLKETVLDDLKAFATEQFDENQDLKPYLKVDFDLPQDERHNWANWWGIYRLWYIHTFVKEFGNKKDIHVLGARRYENYPYLKDHFKQIRNCIAMYLFGYKEASLVNIFNRLVEFKKKADKGDTDPRYDELWLRQDQIRESINVHHAVELPLKLFALREYLRQIKPKILLIDDQATGGWGDIYQQMIYGKDVSDDEDDIYFFTLPENNEQGDGKKISDIEAFYKSVIATIHYMEADVVLLDLRLNGETGTWINTEELSGAQLFKRMRDEEEYFWCKEVPVIITTASNKFWSFEKLDRINGDAKKKHKGHLNENAYYLGYWSKEGLDVVLSDEESIRNYIRLLELIIKPLTPSVDSLFKSLQ